eukprot:SAG11_NODE_484_length_9060_cov_7.118514_7_plen_520_part_00
MKTEDATNFVRCRLHVHSSDDNHEPSKCCRSVVAPPGAESCAKSASQKVAADWDWADEGRDEWPGAAAGSAAAADADREGETSDAFVSSSQHPPDHADQLLHALVFYALQEPLPCARACIAVSVLMLCRLVSGEREGRYGADHSQSILGQKNQGENRAKNWQPGREAGQAASQAAAKAWRTTAETVVTCPVTCSPIWSHDNLIATVHAHRSGRPRCRLRGGGGVWGWSARTCVQDGTERPRLLSRCRGQHICGRCRNWTDVAAASLHCGAAEQCDGLWSNSRCHGDNWRPALQPRQVSVAWLPPQRRMLMPLSFHCLCSTFAVNYQSSLLLPIDGNEAVVQPGGDQQPESRFTDGGISIGEFDEEQSHASFLDALNAWRSGRPESSAISPSAAEQSRPILKSSSSNLRASSFEIQTEASRPLYSRPGSAANRNPRRCACSSHPIVGGILTFLINAGRSNLTLGEMFQKIILPRFGGCQRFIDCERRSFRRHAHGQRQRPYACRARAATFTRSRSWSGAE